MTVSSGVSGTDAVDGGDDTDVVDYSASGAGVIVHTDGTAGAGGDAAGDTLVNVENILGSGHDDQLFGNGSNNILSGNGGNDVLEGGAGSDVLRGGDGI